MINIKYPPKDSARMLNDYVITIDVDWSPDWAISEVMNIFIANKIKSTWFITHNSKKTNELFKYPDLFEVGLHPNFSEGSSQGKNPEEIMANLKEIAPDAVSVRTHGLVQSTRLLLMLREEFNILYDVSIFLPETPNIIPHEVFFSKRKLGLLRFPYFWEDAEEMYRPVTCFSFKHEKNHAWGLKIFNFHPIHIVLNSCDMIDYYNFKKDNNLLELSAADLQPYINKGQGTGTLFKELVQFLSNNAKSSTQTISDLANKWKRTLDDVF
jgi:hypothetical protein